MAKGGLDFFRLDVEFNDSFELVCAEYGSAAFEVIVRLWQRIYKVGYYTEWDTEVALLFGKRWNMGGNVVSEIVECAIRRGIFDKRLFDKHGILTSRRIQLNYFEGTERRKEVKVHKAYLLVSDFKNRENVYITGENVDRNQKNVDRNEQSNCKSNSKSNLKESTLKGTKEKTVFNRFTAPTYETVREYCLERKNKVDAQRFVDYYTANGWMVGKNPMRDWQASVRTWEKEDGTRNKEKPITDRDNYLKHEYSEAQLQSVITNFDKWE